MERFITREPRNDREYVPQHGNRLIGYPSNAPNINTQNNLMPSEIYHGGYGVGAEFSGSSLMQHGGGRFGSVSMGGAGGAPQMGLPMYASTPMHSDQTQMVSGINPQYLAAYADNSSTIIAGQQRMQNDQSSYNFSHNEMTTTGNYNYRSFGGPGGAKTFIPQIIASSSQTQPHQLRREEYHQYNKSLPEMQKFTARDSQNSNSFAMVLSSVSNQQNISQKVPVKQSTEVSFIKNEYENPVKSRFDKLKELHRSGPRAFSGPVEKVLKWHKSLQDIGLLIIYEVVAKCVSIRQGEWCSKHLVIRDDQGPAMQVVYYEIDFLLPELKPPCTIRVVGRMATGTSRLHAFSVRLAAGDDVATLPRRAAVAAHHVAKLCSQYSSNAV